jgi:hypothetical protein
MLAYTGHAIQAGMLREDQQYPYSRVMSDFMLGFESIRVQGRVHCVVHVKYLSMPRKLRL